MLRPDLFRIVIQAQDTAAPAVGAGSLPGAWTQTAEGWEP
jgi:hypothetical protein